MYFLKGVKRMDTKTAISELPPEIWKNTSAHVKLGILLQLQKISRPV
jgi:hypothetical protein